MATARVEKSLPGFSAEITQEEIDSSYLPSLAQTLWRKGFENWDKAFATSDQDLLNRHGIGPTIVTYLRRSQRNVAILSARTWSGRPHLIELSAKDISSGSRGRKLIFIDRFHFVFINPQANRVIEALLKEQVTSTPVLGLEETPLKDLEEAVKYLNRFDLGLELQQREETETKAGLPVKLVLPDDVKVRIIR